MDSFESPQSTAHDIVLHNYLQISGIALLYYDHLDMLPAEIASIWRHPRSISSRIFLLSRYFAFFGNLAMTVLSFRTLPEEDCEHYFVFRQCALLGSQIFICAIMLLRSYALYDRDIRVVIILVGVVLVSTGVACWALTGQQNSIPLLTPGCNVGESRKTGERTAIVWEGLVVYDTVVFIITIIKTCKAGRIHFYGPNPRGKVSLVTLFFRDGAIYFAVIALANLANIVTFYLASPILKGCLSSFASNLSVTMACRLMLNLHAAADTGIMSSPADTPANMFTTLNDTNDMWRDVPSHYWDRISIDSAQGQSCSIAV